MLSFIDVPAQQYLQTLRATERQRRQRFPSRLHRAADAYLVRRGESKTIVAGYPWFTDWGRDTFIALRGLCLATDRLDEAREILLAWAGTVSEGMLPIASRPWRCAGIQLSRRLTLVHHRRPRLLAGIDGEEA